MFFPLPSAVTFSKTFPCNNFFYAPHFGVPLVLLLLLKKESATWPCRRFPNAELVTHPGLNRHPGNWVAVDHPTAILVEPVAKVNDFFHCWFGLGLGSGLRSGGGIKPGPRGKQLGGTQKKKWKGSNKF